MGMVCRVCQRDDRPQIDVALMKSVPYRNIETVFKVSRSALSRHKTGCLPGILTGFLQESTTSQLVERIQQEEQTENGQEPDHSVCSRSDELFKESRRAILDALKRRDFRLAFSGMREARGFLELIGRTTGELSPERAAVPTQPLFSLLPGTMISVTVSQPRENVINVTPAPPTQIEAKPE